MYRLSYYPWLTQNVAPSEIDRQIKLFSTEVEKALQSAGHSVTSIEVLSSVDVPEQIKQIANGDAEIALMNPLGLVFARNRNPDVHAVAVAQRIIDGKVGIEYFAQLYTRKKTAIRTLEGAKGGRIGFGHAYSTSNFLIPAAMLKRAGVHPVFDFSRVEFLRGHEIVARAVYDGSVEIGAGHDGVIIDLARQAGYGDADDVLLQIARSEPIPSDPVAVLTHDEGERRAIGDALVAASATAVGKDALKIFWGNTQGLVATTSDFYRSLESALSLLKLDEEDLLP